MIKEIFRASMNRWHLSVIHSLSMYCVIHTCSVFVFDTLACMIYTNHQNFQWKKNMIIEQIIAVAFANCDSLFLIGFQWEICHCWHSPAHEYLHILWLVYKLAGYLILLTVNHKLNHITVWDHFLAGIYTPAISLTIDPDPTFFHLNANFTIFSRRSFDHCDFSSFFSYTAWLCCDMKILLVMALDWWQVDSLPLCSKFLNWNWG